jgi:hypothetical protein
MTDRGSFWARRRAAVQAEAEADARAARDAEAQARAEAFAERGDAEVLQEMGLPDPATMKSGDDFSGFLSKDVPEHLRRQALRTLWRSNPVLACVDGLNEYDDDYRAAMLLQEPIKTAYQVGKGMLKHIEEMERKAQAAEAQDVEEEPAVEETEEPAIAQEPEAREEQPAVQVALMAEDDAEDVSFPAPRRMRFRFEEASA